MSDTSEPLEPLPYRVELWHRAHRSVERVLGGAISAPLAQAIFHSARREYPDRRITLRFGMSILACSDAQHVSPID